MKNKIFSLLLIFSLVATNVSVIFAENTNYSISVDIIDNGIYVNGEFFTKEEFEEKLKNSSQLEINKISTRSSEVLVAGTWFIPGVGKVVITIAGVIIVGGVVIKSSTWVYKTISTYFSTKKEISDAENSIPNRLKKSSDTVDLGKFTRRVTKKSSKRKESGGWSIEKDYSGHKGSVWKLKNKSDKRVASLDKNGKIVGK